MKEEHNRKSKDVIAYICLCHTDPLLLKRLAKALQYEQDAIFVHVDHKVDIKPFLQACKGLENVYFVKNRVDNFWGGWNSVTATVNTMELALNTGEYTRFVLLQGQDYPLFAPCKIHDYFLQHPNTEYCKAKDVSESKDKIDYMKVCGFWIFDYKRERKLEFLVHGIFSRFNLLGIKYRSPYFKHRNKKWHIYHGWAQWALTRQCVEFLVDCYFKMQDFNHYMKHRFPPDELYFQTLIHNSKFRKNLSRDIVYDREGNPTLLNLTYFEYPKLVKIFTDKEDYDWLKKTGALFVRKINSDCKEILDLIDCEINSVYE